MREIKFRVWDKNKQEMFYDGFYICPDGKLVWRNDAEPKPDSYILMQYTDLKDKNGRKADWWENDLLQSIGSDKRIGQIKYDERYAEWRLYIDGNFWCSLAAAYYDGWEKISNIHEKPCYVKK